MLSTADGVCPSGLSRIVIDIVAVEHLYGDTTFLPSPPPAIIEHLPAAYRHPDQPLLTRRYVPYCCSTIVNAYQ